MRTLGAALTLAAKLLDPVILIASVICGVLFHKWWHLALAALAIALLQEQLLAATQLTRAFSPLSVAFGFAAAGIWAAIAFFAKRMLRKR